MKWNSSSHLKKSYCQLFKIGISTGQRITFPCRGSTKQDKRMDWMDKRTFCPPCCTPSSTNIIMLVASCQPLFGYDLRHLFCLYCLLSSLCYCQPLLFGILSLLVIEGLVLLTSFPVQSLTNVLVNDIECLFSLNKYARVPLTVPHHLLTTL